MTAHAGSAQSAGDRCDSTLDLPVAAGEQVVQRLPVPRTPGGGPPSRERVAVTSGEIRHEC